jgi:preprotein translocase subunit SecG
MYSLLIGIFIVVSALLTFVILIQSSKGGGLAGSFGGLDAMGSVFGSRGTAPFLVKLTSILATLFLLLALVTGLMTRGSVGQRSLIEKEREKRMSSPARTLPQVPEPAPEQPPQ